MESLPPPPPPPLSSFTGKDIYLFPQPSMSFHVISMMTFPFIMNLVFLEYVRRFPFPFLGEIQGAFFFFFWEIGSLNCIQRRLRSPLSPPLPKLKRKRSTGPPSPLRTGISRLAHDDRAYEPTDAFLLPFPLFLHETICVVPPLFLSCQKIYVHLLENLCRPE